MTLATVNLTNHFLIAMPSMVDPNFSRTLTFICEHNANGALGVVVNRPSEIDLSTLFKQLDLNLPRRQLAKTPVLQGGPVHVDRGFVLHRPVGAWKSTLSVGERVGLTTSMDILEALGQGGGPDELLVTLGYSGWSAGQLENEILQNAWLTVEAREDILFDMDAEARLPAAMALLGVNYATLTDTAGHA